MSVFFIDSNSELWFTEAEKLGIKHISMPYTLDGVEHGYDLGKTHDHKKFFSKVRKGLIPITSALNPQNYIEIFEPYLMRGEDILYVTFSRELSSTFDFLDTAIEILKEKYPNQSIKYIDTKSISLGAGIIAYEAAVMHKRGATDDEIIDFIKSFRKNIATYFTVDDLMHLKRGGRISTMSAVIGSTLGIKPILCVNDEGKIISHDKVMGRKKALSYLANLVKVLGKNVADYPIGILHADAEDDALILKEKIQQIAGKDARIWLQPIGPTTGTHCGPKTIALAFHAKQRIQK